MRPEAASQEMQARRFSVGIAKQSNSRALPCLRSHILVVLFEQEALTAGDLAAPSKEWKRAKKLVL